MDEEDYLELARFLRAHLEEIGLHDIGDIGSYMDDDEGERPAPDGRTLIKKMLESFDRYLVVNAEETVEQSLSTIRETTLGAERIGTALVHLQSEERAFLEGRAMAEPVATLGAMSEVRTELKRLEEFLMQDPKPPGPGWRM